MEFFKSGSVGGAGSNACFYLEANPFILCGLTIFRFFDSLIIFLLFYLPNGVAHLRRYVKKEIQIG